MRNHSGQNTYLSLLSLEMKQDAAYKWPLRERLASPTALSEAVLPRPLAEGNARKIEGDGLSKGGRFLINFSDRQDFFILAFSDIFLTPLFRTDRTAEHRKHS